MLMNFVIQHLITLLDCADGDIILAVLNLIYVFSKRSNYLSRLPSDKKKILQEKLVDLAQVANFIFLIT